MTSSSLSHNFTELKVYTETCVPKTSFIYYIYIYVYLKKSPVIGNLVRSATLQSFICLLTAIYLPLYNCLSARNDDSGSVYFLSK